MESSWMCFTCSFQFDDSLSFCLHLHEKHPNSKVKAGENLVSTNDRIFCQMCSGCFEDERSHEERHYLTKIGAGALLECPRCYKMFKTLDQMKEHLHSVHEDQAKLNSEQCHVCFRLFKNRNLRDQHIVGHLTGVLNRIMDKIDIMQSKLKDQFTSNMCPLCGFVMSTRRSLKQHVLFQHVLRSQKDLSFLIGTSNLDNIDEELRICRKMIANPGLLWKRQDKSKVTKTPVTHSSTKRQGIKQEPNEFVLCNIKKETQKSG